MEENQTEEVQEIQPTPSLPITDSERAAIDAAIEQWAKLGKRRGVFSESTRYREIIADQDLCKRADELIAEGLVSIKTKVKEDTAEKMFDRLAKIVDDWKDRDEQTTLAIVFFRYMDTMRFFMAYRGKYRGRERKSSLTKQEALAELKARGLTKGKS